MYRIITINLRNVTKNPTNFRKPFIIKYISICVSPLHHKIKLKIILLPEHSEYVADVFDISYEHTIVCGYSDYNNLEGHDSMPENV